MAMQQLPPTINRPEGRSLQSVRAGCGHKVVVTWDNRFPPDALDLDNAVALWADRTCGRCASNLNG